MQVEFIAKGVGPANYIGEGWAGLMVLGCQVDGTWLAERLSRRDLARRIHAQANSELIPLGRARIAMVLRTSTEQYRAMSNEDLLLEQSLLTLLKRR